jgi:NAD-dependent dihydropyrimidine dehydrogenase PreA subunit
MASHQTIYLEDGKDLRRRANDDIQTGAHLRDLLKRVEARCPVDCIYDGIRKGYIHPDECVDCGACEPVCPVTAIFHEDDVPADWAVYARIDREFFGSENRLGLPGRRRPGRLSGGGSPAPRIPGPSLTGSANSLVGTVACRASRGRRASRTVE